ncbi:MAG TPA: transglutaminase-like domain-containing protein [Thermomicrobiales bacterium]|jgi:regulator of sirC expression with transglutaminase-like and TPR domain
MDVSRHAALTPPDEPTAAAFAALMRERDEDLPLDRAAVLLARGIAYPDLDLEAPLAALDDLADGLRSRLPASPDPHAIAVALRDYLGNELGFRGPASESEDAYYDARNSYLNDVLGRHVGIPIGLAIVYIEVARRIDFSLVGVGMPLHFVIKHSLGDAPEDGIFMDPFLGGALLTPQQLRQRFEAQFRDRMPFAEHFLGAVTKKQLLTRVLNNLRGVYLGRQQLHRALSVLDYLLLIAPWDLETRRDRGLLALRIGEFSRALDDLQAYERFATSDPNLPVIRGHIEALRRRFTLGG